MAGFVARTGVMAGVHDPLWARAICWSGRDDPAAAAGLVVLDVLGLDGSLVTRIRHEAERLTGIPGGQLAVAATHTHSGPAVMSDGFFQPPDQTYVDGLVTSAAQSVSTALAACEPVRLGFAVGHEPTVGKNRRQAGGPIDPQLPLMWTENPAGTVSSLLLSYACHPVTLGPDNLLATADYPGYAIRTLERVYEGATVVFATGCCGDINTGHLASDSVTAERLGRRTYPECERLGRLLAASAIVATERCRGEQRRHGAENSVQPGFGSEVRVARATLELPLLPQLTATELAGRVLEWEQEAEDLEASGAPAGVVMARRCWAQWARRAIDAGPAEPMVRTEVMAIGVGPVTIVTLPGEPFSRLGLAIKRSLADEGVVVLGYTNGVAGYVPDRLAYTHGGYEVEEAHRFYGRPAAFAPEAGEALVEEAVRLVQQVKADRRDHGAISPGGGR